MHDLKPNRASHISYSKQLSETTTTTPVLPADFHSSSITADQITMASSSPPTSIPPPPISDDSPPQSPPPPPPTQQTPLTPTTQENGVGGGGGLAGLMLSELSLPSLSGDLGGSDSPGAGPVQVGAM